MDFKSLLNKLDSMEAPEATPKAPTLPASVRLDEDAQLRVLAGTSTILAEAKKKDDADKKADDKKKADKKDEKVEEGFPTVADAKAKAEKEKTTGKFDKKDTSTGTVYTRKSSTFTDGGDDADTKKAKKKAKSESIDPTAFRSKFEQMVEAKKEDAKKKDKSEDSKKTTKKASALNDIVTEGFEAKKAEQDKDIYKLKLRRAYDVAMEMQSKGLIGLSKTALDKQVDDIMDFDDKAFEAFKRSVANTRSVNVKKAGLDLGGLNVGVESDVAPSPAKSSAEVLKMLWDK
jgi:hypothetical protein